MQPVFLFQLLRRLTVATIAPILKTARLAFVAGDPRKGVPGEAIHEMGTARMGNNSTEAFLNQWNQAHEVPNLFFTDSACMTSSFCVAV